MQFLLVIAATACVIKDATSTTCGCHSEAATGCSDGPSPGATRLASYFKSHFGGTTEIYNCRNIAGSDRYSLHAEGRAVDLYLTGEEGRQAFDHAVEIACTNGIQEVIFDRRIWTNENGEKDYSGSNPHIDHVHIGLNKCGAEHFED